MISRRSRVHEKHLTRKGFLLLLTSVGLLFLLLFFGIPLLAKFAAFVSELKNSSTPIAQEDKTPPTSPSLDPLPQFVREPRVTVNGRAEAGSTLKLFVNDTKVKEILIGETSTFSAEITLEKGSNRVITRATDSFGNEGEFSGSQTIVYDIDPPVMTVEKPSDGETFYGSQKIVEVAGITEPNVKITINERVVVVDSEGKFSQRVSLSEGENNLNIVAIDEAENKTEKTITVTYSP